ncbi:MAG: Crp/Fnr family transcriptional regulator, partial [Parvularculaceae bacterium]|nr:Crp/Fnr family transcriptional regulator [Parvularculaceae bacterium]
MKRAGDADTDFKIRSLKLAALFEAAAEEDLAELARVARPLAVQRGKPFVKSGAEGEQIFLIQTGVTAELQSDSAEGESLLVALSGAGDVVGVVSALARQEKGRGAQTFFRRLQALSNVTALAIPAADFFRICRRSTDLSTGLAHALAQEASDVAALFVQSVAASLEARLSGFFSRVADLTSTEDWNPSTNIGHVSQSAVAQMLGVSREHVNRTLAMWERSGLIFQNKTGEVVVQNRKRLAALAGDRSRAGAEKGDEWLWEIDAHLDHGLNQTAQHLALEAVKRAPKELKYA